MSVMYDVCLCMYAMHMNVYTYIPLLSEKLTDILNHL